MPEETINYEKGLTFEKVWASIQKLGDKIESLTDKYDAIFEREAKERQEWLKAEEERRKAADKSMAELKKFVAETSRIVLGTNSKIGYLDKRFGEVIEHLVAPNIAARFNEIDYDFKEISERNLKIFENDQVITEVDILLENSKTIAVVEVKATPTKRDIKKHLKRIPIVRQWYCQLHGNTDKEFIGAIAGAVFLKNVKQFAIENGFYVVIPSGDTLKIDVPKDFKPKIF
jgi:hypothetical protein